MSERSFRRQRDRELQRARRRTARRVKRGALATGAALGATALIAPAAEAAEFEVDTTSDDPTDGLTLREAVEAANTNGEADLITFMSGLSGDIVLSNPPGEISIDTDGGNDLEIRGPGQGQLAVDGDYDTRIFNASGAGALTISGLTFKNGYAEPVAIPFGPEDVKYFGAPGGAILSSVDSLTISDSTFVDNEATKYGGAISHEGATFDFARLTIADNVASEDGGGAYLLSSGSIVDTTISGNVASGVFTPPSGAPKYSTADGGGVLIEGDAEIKSSKLVDNETELPPLGSGAGAGGMRFDDGELLVEQSEFRNNSAAGDEDDGESGGALEFRGTKLELLTSTVAGNTSAFGPGGLYTEGGEMIIRRSTVSGNEGAVGGIRTYDYADDEAADPENGLLLSNSTVSGNSAIGSSTTPGERSGYGGGLYVSGENGATIQNSTIAKNSAEVDGGGIFSYAGADYEDEGNFYTARSRVLSSTIVGDNTAAGAKNDLATEIEGAGGDRGLIAGFSLIEAPGSAALSSDPSGSNVLGEDPKLGPLADNGGPTETHLPELDSPAIDQGTANGLAIDQRGEPRTVDAGIANADDGTDGGSVEVGDATGPTTKIVFGPGEGQTVLGDEVRFGFEADEEATFECKLDEGPFRPCETPFTLRDLSSGFHVFHVRGTDLAGNRGNVATRVFKTIGDFCNGTPATIVADPGVPTVGTDGDDVIVGTEGADQINGAGGDDQICALGGADVVRGGAGDDAITGQNGGDELRGGGGADELFGEFGGDELLGGAGDDKLAGNEGADELRGKGGDDRLKGRQGVDDLAGGGGDDRLGGGPRADLLRGDDGADIIRGGRGGDDLRGAGGDDEIHGARGRDDLRGGADDDLLNGGKGRNSCNGGSGENILRNCD